MILRNIHYNKNARNKHSFFSSNIKKAALISCIFGSLLLFASCSKKPKLSDTSQILENGTFIDGVSIYNVDVSGKSLSEAKVLVSSQITQDQSSATITLVHDVNMLNLNLFELNMTNNLEDVLQSALLFGQNGSKKENEQVQEQTAISKKDFEISFTPDENSISQKLSEFAALVEKSPQEPKAVLNAETNKIEFAQGAPGVALNSAATKALIDDALSEGEFPTTINAVVSTTAPTKSNEEVQANTKLMAKFSTSFDGNSKPERVFNIDLGAKKINGKKVNPGETFSFNQIVGPRDAKNNWQQAATIVNGNTFEDDYGGGICQVSTTLYIAVAKSDLKIVNRQRHSIPSSYVPLGMDATVAYGSKDFVFQNNKDHPIYVFATVDKGGKSIEVSIYGPSFDGFDEVKLRKVVVEEIQPPAGEIVEDASAKPGSKETVIKRRTGYVVDVFKDYIKNGEVIRSEKMHNDTYRAEPGVVKVGGIGGGASTTPSTSKPVDESSIPPDTNENSGNEVVDIPVEDSDEIVG